MIIAHLLFAHLLADYVLQTDWLAARKGQAWDGLLLHGFMVFVMSVLVLAPYFEQTFLAVCMLAVVHTTQDWVKVRVSPRLRIHLAWNYFADQFGHLVAILVFQAIIGKQVDPGNFEIFVMALGAALIAVTRFYDVSWWANWFEMILYMNEWRWWAYVERGGILLLSSLGIVPALLSPLIALPRLYWAWRSGSPLWTQPYGMIEWALGIGFSVVLGYFGLFQILQYS